MFCNISSLINRIISEDLETASASKLQSIGAIAMELSNYSENVKKTLQKIHQISISKFSLSQIEDDSEKWLKTLLHIFGEEAEDIFENVFDDDLYNQLHNKKSQIESRWTSEILDILQLNPSPIIQLPLSKRIKKLINFYQNDINVLTNGDDEQAAKILQTAEQIFQTCKSEINPNDLTTFFDYYHLIKTKSPGYRYEKNINLYKDYKKLFNLLDEPDEDSDEYWKYLEVKYYIIFEKEKSFDKSLLQRLTFAENLACQEFRIQILKWILDFDPETENTIQEYRANINFVKNCIARLSSYLKFHPSISVDKFVNIWYTIELAAKYFICDESLEVRKTIDFAEVENRDLREKLEIFREGYFGKLLEKDTAISFNQK